MSTVTARCQPAPAAPNGATAQQEFGQRVRAFRKEQKLTIRELAKRVGIHWSYLGQLERGVRNPSLTTISDLAAGLRVTAPDLIAGLGARAEEVAAEPARSTTVGGDPVLAELGRRVRVARQGAGLKQEDVAVAVGQNRTYLSMIERGKRNLPVRTLVRVAAVIGVDPAELIVGLHELDH